jgi:phosphate transport system permease protein
MRMTGVRSMGLGLPGASALTLERLIPVAATAASALALTVAFLTAAYDPTDFLSEPALGVLVLALVALMVQVRQQRGRLDRELLVLSVASGLGLVALLALPEWLYGYNLNAIIHHSFFSSMILFTVGITSFSHTLYFLLGGTPSARDISRYPLIIFPIVIVLIGYGMVVGYVLDKGVPHIDPDILTHAYTRTIENGQFINHPGMRNHILGTLLLVGMTCLFALPIGVGAGIHMAEYRGWSSRLIGFSTTMLRAFSVFIIAVAAFNMVDLVSDRGAGDPLSDAIRGYYSDDTGTLHPSHGSYLLAAAFLATLVVPVIARATEEGFRSVPRDIREGSLSLGATEGHSLTRLYFPWALPQIVTGMLIGAAEAAGTVTVLLFIAGTGEFGVGPLREPTSLGFFIFQAHYGPDPFVKTMQSYQFTAAVLLLVITLSLTIAALYLKSRARASYRGLYAD